MKTPPSNLAAAISGTASSARALNTTPLGLAEVIFCFTCTRRRYNARTPRRVHVRDDASWQERNGGDGIRPQRAQEEKAAARA